MSGEPSRNSISNNIGKTERPTGLANLKAPSRSRAPRITWQLALQLFILLLAILGATLLLQGLDLDRLGQALAGAERRFWLLAILAVLVNLLIKTWRWQSIFAPPGPTPNYLSTAAAFALGALVNLAVPLRLGELARLAILRQLAKVSVGRAAGTIAVEKAFEGLALLLSGVVLLPLIALPDLLKVRLEWLAILFLVLTIGLSAGAFLGNWLTRKRAHSTHTGDSRMRERIEAIIVKSLQSLSILRQPRRVLVVALLSATSIVFAVATPLLLFRAFKLGLGLEQAVLLNLVVSIGLIPPTTPGKLVIFEALALYMLQQFGITDQALALGYAIVYHLVVLVPQLLLGLLALTYVGLRLGADWRLTLLANDRS